MLKKKILKQISIKLNSTKNAFKKSNYSKNLKSNPKNV